jgi:hypothetical protein
MKKAFSILILACTRIILYGQIVADHTVVDKYNDIPQQWIDSVKTKLVWIPGMSHGYGYFRGAELLELLDSRFQVDIWIDASAPAKQNTALRLGRPGLTREGFWTSQSRIASIEENTIKEQHDIGNPFDFIWFGWSYQGTWENGLGGGNDPVYNVQWAGSTLDGPNGNMRWGLDAEDKTLTGNSVCMDTYLAAIEQYNQYCIDQGIKTKVLFSNGVVDGDEGTELAFQRELKNQHIRDYVSQNGDNNTYFLDYADILVYNNAGQLNTVNWNDAGTNRPHQQIHPDNLMDYDASFNVIPPGVDAIEDHIGEVGTVRLAKAMWWLLARACGWNSEITAISKTAKTHDFNLVQSTDKLIIKLNNKSINVSQYLLYNIEGILLYQKEIVGDSFDIDISLLTPGIYFIQLLGIRQNTSVKILIP